MIRSKRFVSAIKSYAAMLNLFQHLFRIQKRLDRIGYRKVSFITAFLLASLRSLIYIYRGAISPWIRPRCRFLPTCSQYALDALGYYGPYKGSILALKRLCRCHPWGGHGFDPVKEE